ncbi:hypothetical protein L3X38_020343 [Prunus dulcis]|uniref:Uncharacterized protein n=1 Tax=Prunus dulcis TaxID=3755 RepID=A0AAD4WCW1_PRUDU|nr:hypothetical protein L3X38_020343 [Prunus dulcis]
MYFMCSCNKSKPIAAGAITATGQHYPWVCVFSLGVAAGAIVSNGTRSAMLGGKQLSPDQQATGSSTKPVHNYCSIFL